MTGPRRWGALTSAELATLDHARAVAVLPTAAIEQHGPHLPLAVDAIINEGVLDRALALAPPDLPVLVLPALAVGKSNEHADFAGTLTLSAETLIRLATEIGEGAARAGLRKLMFFNSHGGQPQVLDIVAQDLRARLGMLAVVANSWRMMRADALFPAAELREGIHAGAIETSIMLHLRPDLVRRDQIRRFESAARPLVDDYPLLAPDGRLGFAWQSQDLNAAGAVGDATLADAEKGRVMVENAALALVDLWREMCAMPMETLRRR